MGNGSYRPILAEFYCRVLYPAARRCEIPLEMLNESHPSLLIVRGINVPFGHGPMRRRFVHAIAKNLNYFAPSDSAVFRLVKRLALY